MHNFKLSFGLILFSSLLALNAEEIDESTKYSIKDLEILEKEKNYQEFFKHAYDLKPSLRTKYWKKLYSSMAIGLIDEKLKLKDYSTKTFEDVEAFNKNVHLSEDEIFQNKRNQYALNYFKECFALNSNKTDCEKKLTIHWENSNKDADNALYFAKLADLNNLKIDTWTFYHSIVHDQIAPLYCKKMEVQHAIIKKIELITYNSEFDGNYKIMIAKLMDDKCFKELIPTFKAALYSNKTSGMDKELALNILWQHKLLTNNEIDIALTNYLLSGPVVGEKMNLAWKLIESLAENYPRRKIILDGIKAFDLIPDKIFEDPKSERNRAIINLFTKNFPELINYYAQNCMDYINNVEGSKAPNKTTCDRFLNTANAEKNNWVSDSIKTQYSSLKK